MSHANAVTWRWLVSILMSILIVGGGAWMTTMYAEVGRIKEDAKVDRLAVGQVDRKVGVIEERTQRTERDVQEIRRDQQDQNKKLDELLRRIPSSR